jgi:hypothetical protein
LLPDLLRLKTLLRRGLMDTANLWPDIRTGYRWVHRTADILSNEAKHNATTVKRRLGGLLSAMPLHQATAGTLAPALAPFQKVTRSYWSGLFPCYSVPDLPRTNNALAQFFGAHRYHERRATGRKVASPALVLSGSVRLVAAAATRLHTCCGEELAPETIGAWKTLRQDLATRRQQRTLRRRFRADSASYLAKLEADILQLTLPP